MIETCFVAVFFEMVGMQGHESYLARLFAPENLPNVGLFLAGVGGIIVAIRTLEKIGRQTKATEDAVRASQVSANAAKSSSDALINIERAWLMLDLDNTGNTGIDTRDDGTGIGVYFSLRNYGRTTAWITSYAFRSAVMDGHILSFPIEYGNPTDVSYGIPVPPGSTTPLYWIPYNRRITDDQINKLNKSVAYPHLWGMVIYKDAFGEKRETYFHAVAQFKHYIPGRTNPNEIRQWEYSGPEQANRYT